MTTTTQEIMNFIDERLNELEKYHQTWQKKAKASAIEDDKKHYMRLSNETYTAITEVQRIKDWIIVHNI